MREQIRSLQARLQPPNGLDGLQHGLPLLVGLFLLAGLSYAVLNLKWYVPIGLLAGIFGSLFFFIQPLPALMAMIALRVLLDLLWWVPGGIAGLNILKLFSGAATVLSGAMFLLEFRRIERHPCMGAFLLFVIVLTLSAARNISLLVGLEIAVRYLSPMMLIFLVAGFFKTQRAERMFMMMLLMVTCIPLVVSLYHLMTGQMNQFSLGGYNRLLGGYKSSRHHGMMMMLMASMGIFYFFQVRTWRNQGAILLYVLGSLTCMYFTHIRTSILAFIGFAGVFFYISQRHRELYLMLGMTILVTIVSPEVQDRFKDLVLVFMIDESDVFSDSRKIGSGRLGLWGDSLKAYLRQPLGDILLGLGLGRHWQLTQEAYNPFIVVQDGQVDTHSDYLGMLYQLGPIALGAYLFMQFQTLLIGWRLAMLKTADRFSRDLGALAAALSVAVFVTNTISNGFVNRTTLGWFFWSVAGLMFAVYAREKSAQETLHRQAIPLHPSS